MALKSSLIQCIFAIWCYLKQSRAIKIPRAGWPSAAGSRRRIQNHRCSLKAVTAPSWALIWTLTKAYFTINWSCRAYNGQAGGVRWKPGAEWLGKLAFFSFQKFNVILLNWRPVSCMMNSQLSRSWFSSVCLSQVSCISLSICFCFLLEIPPVTFGLRDSCNCKADILNGRRIPPPDPPEDIGKVWRYLRLS